MEQLRCVECGTVFYSAAAAHMLVHASCERCGAALDEDPRPEPGDDTRPEYGGPVAT